MLVLLFTFNACSSDDEPEIPSCSNQVLSGSIDEISFDYQGGVASVFDSEFNYDIYDVRETFDLNGICDGRTQDFVRMFGRLPLTEGRIDLSFSGTSGQTITFFNPDNFLNIIMSEGYVDIKSISSTEIVGFMDVDNGEDFACGDFTLTICQ